MYECIKKLGEIASAKGGSGFPKKYQGKKEGQYPFFKVSDMNLAGNEIYMNHAANYVDDADLAAMKAKFHPAGTIVFPKIGGAISTNKKRLLTCDAIFDNNVMGVVPNTGVSSEYIYKFFVSLDLYDLSNKAALPSITAGSVSELEIPLPPIPEQQRIVAILDQAFADIEKARANAEKNLKNARELFDSYLNQVFSQRGEGWVEKSLGETCIFQGGSQPPKSEFSIDQKPGYIRLIQIRDYKSDKRAVYIPRVKSKRYCLADDVMIGRYGPPLFQILRGIEGSYNVALIKVSPKDGLITKDYLYYFLRNRDILKYIIDSSSRAAGQIGLNKKTIEPYPIGFPPIEEQIKICAQLKDLAIKTTHLESISKEKLNSLDELKKSLLQKAFSGELTKTEGQAA